MIITCFSFDSYALTKITYEFQTGEEVVVSKVRMMLDGSSSYNLNRKVAVMEGMSLIRSSFIEAVDGENCISVEAKKEGQIIIMAAEIESKLTFCSQYIEYSSNGYRRVIFNWSNDETKETELIESLEYSSFLALIKEHLGIDNRDNGKSYTVNKNPSNVIACRAEGFVASLLLPHKVLCSPPSALGERYTPQVKQSCTRKYVWSTNRSSNLEVCLKINSIDKEYITTINRGCAPEFTEKEFSNNQSEHFNRTIICEREIVD